VSPTTVYAGQIAFAKSADEPTVEDPLAAGLSQRGMRFNTDMRRQMYEPTPLGFAIQTQDSSGGDASFAVQWDVDRNVFEKAGGRTVGTSADGGARDAKAVFDRVTLGELKLGKGQVRIAGALLPQPTEKYDHPQGLEPHAVTTGGYLVFRNLLETVVPGVVAKANHRFAILTRRLRVRKAGETRRIARVRVRCKSRLGCYGKLSLMVRKRKRAGRRSTPERTQTRDQDAPGASAAGKKKGRVKLVSIGRKRLRMKKSATRVVRVRLTLEGRRLQRRTKKLVGRAVAPVRFGPNGNGGSGTAKRRLVMLRAKGDRPRLVDR
jgi:hypothetical protein